MTTKQLDAKGLRCPLPVLKARRAMKELTQGDVLEIESTDPGSVADFANFCETTGHRLLDQESSQGIYSFRIEKAS